MKSCPQKRIMTTRDEFKGGLFQAKETLVNADVNGSLQIMKKVFPNSYTGYGIEVVLTPTIINVV